MIEAYTQDIEEQMQELYRRLPAVRRQLSCPVDDNYLDRLTDM